LLFGSLKLHYLPGFEFKFYLQILLVFLDFEKYRKILGIFDFFKFFICIFGFEFKSYLQIFICKFLVANFTCYSRF